MVLGQPINDPSKALTSAPDNSASLIEEGNKALAALNKDLNAARASADDQQAKLEDLSVIPSQTEPADFRAQELAVSEKLVSVFCV